MHSLGEKKHREHKNMLMTKNYIGTSNYVNNVLCIEFLFVTSELVHNFIWRPDHAYF